VFSKGVSIVEKNCPMPGRLYQSKAQNKKKSFNRTVKKPVL
jgi:hypothetical protein